MFCNGFDFPTDLGIRISQLKPGDQIIILAGEGYPQVAEDTLDIVWQVAGFSALTAKGTRISCRFNSDIIETGKIIINFEVSDEAKKIQKEIDEINKEDSAIDLGGALLFGTDEDGDPTQKFKGGNWKNFDEEPE